MKFYDKCINWCDKHRFIGQPNNVSIATNLKAGKLKAGI